MIEKILESMLQEIGKYGLELMQHYPNDLLVHDRATLEQHAVPGAVIGWMVGHLHTHIAPLGIHQEDNRTVTYLTNLASEDRFYKLEVLSTGHRLKEVTREQFGALSSTPIPYSMQGGNEAFWLMKGQERIGFVAIERAGDWQEFVYESTITPRGGISAKDRAALQVWCNRAAISLAHSLFVRQKVTWAEPVRLAHAA